MYEITVKKDKCQLFMTPCSKFFCTVHIVRKIRTVQEPFP